MAQKSSGRMPGGQCSEPGCSAVAWEECQRCHRTFCFTHARFVPHEVARGHAMAMLEFEFVCLECLANTADEDAWGDYQRGTSKIG